jgi:hypothetical protein
MSEDWEKVGQQVGAALIGLFGVTMALAIVLQIGLWLWQ